MHKSPPPLVLSAAVRTRRIPLPNFFPVEVLMIGAAFFLLIGL